MNHDMILNNLCQFGRYDNISFYVINMSLRTGEASSFLNITEDQLPILEALKKTIIYYDYDNFKKQNNEKTTFDYLEKITTEFVNKDEIKQFISIFNNKNNNTQISIENLKEWLTLEGNKSITDFPYHVNLLFGYLFVSGLLPQAIMHKGPLVSYTDESENYLALLHKNGVFTINGQGPSKTDTNIDISYLED